MGLVALDWQHQLLAQRTAPELPLPLWPVSLAQVGAAEAVLGWTGCPLSSIVAQATCLTFLSLESVQWGSHGFAAQAW